MITKRQRQIEEKKEEERNHKMMLDYIGEIQKWVCKI